MNYSEEVAVKILELIREGETLSQICEVKGMPERLEVYDWLRDPDLKVGKDTFAQAMSLAEDDQAMSWRDEVLQEMASMTITGHRVDAARMRQLTELATLRLKFISLRTRGKKTESGSNVTVVLRNFGEDVDIFEEGQVSTH